MSELLLEPRGLSYMLQVLSKGIGGCKRVYDHFTAMSCSYPLFSSTRVNEMVHFLFKIKMVACYG